MNSEFDSHSWLHAECKLRWITDVIQIMHLYVRMLEFSPFISSKSIFPIFPLFLQSTWYSVYTFKPSCHQSLQYDLSVFSLCACSSNCLFIKCSLHKIMKAISPLEFYFIELKKETRYKLICFANKIMPRNNEKITRFFKKTESKRF